MKNLGRWSADLRRYVTFGTYGDCFSVPGEWESHYATFMRDNNIFELAIISARGFVGSNINFLETVPFLVSLEVITHAVDDMSPIETLRNLMSLNLDRSGKYGVDFRIFHNLKELMFQWRPKSESVFECTSLEDLYVTQFPGKTTARFSSLSNLQRLIVSQGSVGSIEKLENLTRLEKFGLFLLRNLTSLNGIEGLKSLKELDVRSCNKITSLDELSGLNNLTKVAIDNCGAIASLAPLRDLHKLQQVTFIENTTILDGDMSPLADLPNLKTVAFRDRKHYSLRRGQLDPRWL